MHRYSCFATDIILSKNHWSLLLLCFTVSLESAPFIYLINLNSGTSSSISDSAIPSQCASELFVVCLVANILLLLHFNIFRFFQSSNELKTISDSHDCLMYSCLLPAKLDRYIPHIKSSLTSSRVMPIPICTLAFNVFVCSTVVWSLSTS